MGDPSEAGFNPANHDRGVSPCLAQPLAVDGDGAIGALACHIPGRVGIIVASLSIGGVMVDHRIHIAGGDAKK